MIEVLKTIQCLTLSCPELPLIFTLDGIILVINLVIKGTYTLSYQFSLVISNKFAIYFKEIFLLSI